LDTDPLPTPCLSVNLSILLSRIAELIAPESWIGWATIVIIACICLSISAFVSGSEIAYFSLTPAEIDDLREDNDDTHCQKAYSLISDSERLLAVILIANNLVNITMVVLLTFAINQTVIFHSDLVSFLFQTVFLTFLLLLFGEIFPKLVARGKRLSWVRMASSPLTILCELLKIPANIMVKSGSFMDKFVTKKSQNISTDDLETALEISDVKEGKDKEMLEGILSFGEKEVSDIMISRVDVTDIECHATWDEVVGIILRSGFSRIPVYDTSQDYIKGILYSKDLLPYIGKRDNTFRWQSLIREAYFVPESRMIDDLLEDFRRRKIHIAVVIDEYGCTQGIVTLEDIIEEIVGEVEDEYDDEEKLYQQISPDTFIFEGRIPLSDFYRVTGIEEEEFADIAGEQETLAGLLLAIKGDFPTKKEAFVYGRCRFLVLEIQKHRITSVRAMIMPVHTESDN
jgi:gliding motility-associated protein GldE